MVIFRILSTFLLVFSFVDSFAQVYTLAGKIKGINGDGWAFVRHRQTGKTDSGIMLNGSFTVSGAATAPEFCNFGMTVNGLKDYYFGFFLESGHFTMKANKDSLNDISILFTGSKTEKEFQQFQRQVDSINRLHYPQDRADAALEKLTSAFTLKHLKSYVSAFALISYENELATLSSLYSRLAVEIQRSYYGRLIKEKMMRR
jgi:hypothetical protein